MTFWADAVAAASALMSTATTLTSIGFGIAKATTRFGFSVARDIANIVPIPLLDTSLTHLESLSLLPILLGESIACTSLVAASTSLDLISDLLHAENEASCSLAAVVSLIRSEWAEHEAAGRSVTEVARAVAAWAAVQGFTKQWGEDRWLKYVQELTPDDFRPPDKSELNRSSRRRTISRVSVTEDVIMIGRSGQVVSADIGEKKDTTVNYSSSTHQSRGSSSPTRRSNYETRKSFQRLSKMVLAGYGGAGLLFFGVPLHPDDPTPTSFFTSPPNGDLPGEPRRTDSEVKNSEEKILVHAVEDAEVEAMSPSMTISKGESQQSQDPLIRPPITIKTNREPSPAAPSSAYSWWNILLGKHDREIFEGFAFTPAEDTDNNSARTPFTPSSSPTKNSFPRLSRRNSSFRGFSTSTPTRNDDPPPKRKEPKPPTATIGDLSKMPRFWVLTDHARRQVVLVVRGTMSYHELRVDLQCEPETFEPATATSPCTFKPTVDTLDSGLRMEGGDGYFSASAPDAVNYPSVPFPTMEGMPGSFGAKPPPFLNKRTRSKSSLRSRASVLDMTAEQPRAHAAPSSTEDPEDPLRYQVHSGMFQLARAMGSPGKPVQEAVSSALARNRGYELVLCGHSLGAGVASLLALLWADPMTCRTVPSSGLPSNRRVSAYCFAPPCVMSPALSRLCQNLITSLVYSFDIVSRLSLGSCCDLSRAAYWLCEGRGGESSTSVLYRSLQGKISFVGGKENDTEDEKKWFIALRKTLEANMYFADLFPPGRVWWAVRDEALHPSHQRRGGIRLYEVPQVEHVFHQIEFKGDMLSSHLPHQYDRMLAELNI